MLTKAELVAIRNDTKTMIHIGFGLRSHEDVIRLLDDIEAMRPFVEAKAKEPCSWVKAERATEDEHDPAACLSESCRARRLLGGEA